MRLAIQGSISGRVWRLVSSLTNMNENEAIYVMNRWIERITGIGCCQSPPCHQSAAISSQAPAEWFTMYAVETAELTRRSPQLGLPSPRWVL